MEENKKVITFGCRLNAYESDVIQKNLESSGLEDVVIFNTCAVTKEAERQARQSIRKFIRNNPNKKIVVTGCSAQIKPEQYSEIDGVFKVIGNEEKMHKKTYDSISKHKNQETLLQNEKTEKILVNDIFSITETASHLVTNQQDRARAFMQIQNGCNHRCTFCIIPYGRGNSRSVPIPEIVKQAQHLTEQGYNEIVLTGVDVTDYGLDLPGKPKLGQMIRRLLALVPNIKRIRLSSVDVAEIDEDIFYLLENDERFMPHFHLSLQAGDNMILKRMKRRHTRENVIEFFEKARKIRPDVVFGADIIAGFPTESDEMFENSLKIIKETEIIHAHIFPYSEREGTPAAKIPANKQIPPNIRKDRAKLLRDESEKELRNFLESRVNKEENIIIEKEEIGRTEHFIQVKLKNKYQTGSIQKIKTSALEGNFLVQ